MKLYIDMMEKMYYIFTQMQSFPYSDRTVWRINPIAACRRSLWILILSCFQMK